jgi:hypothetical protein
VHTGFMEEQQVREDVSQETTQKDGAIRFPRRTIVFSIFRSVTTLFLP